MNTVDLHLHSHYSEAGELSVLDLIHRVEASSITLASIVDPNVIASAKEIRAFKRHSKVQWIEAIEIHSVFNLKEISVIGYGIDPEYEWFQDLEARIQSAHQATLNTRLEALNKAFKVELESSYFLENGEHRILNPQRIASLVLQYAHEKQLDAFKAYRPKGAYFSKNHKRFIEEYFALDKLAYVQVELPSMQEVVEHIHKAGGLAVLAHPGINLKENKSLLSEMIHVGLDGVEAYSPYHTEFQNVFYVEFALLRKLLITCGSDFYGSKIPQLKMGLTHCPIDADSMLQQFKSRGIII